MRTEFNTSYNAGFNGTFVRASKVHKFDKLTSKFNEVNTNIVLLDSFSKGDVAAVNKVAAEWGKPSFTNTIATCFEWTGILSGKSHMRYYAITEQARNFEKLDSDKILGIAETEEIKRHKAILYHLQVKPSAQNLNKQSSEYKHVGVGFVRGLQHVYNKISLTSVRDDNVRGFYRFLGFRESFLVADRYSWRLGFLGKLKRFLGKDS